MAARKTLFGLPAIVNPWLGPNQFGLVGGKEAVFTGFDYGKDGSCTVTMKRMPDGTWHVISMERQPPPEGE